MIDPMWECLRCEKNLIGLPYEIIEIFEDKECLRPILKRICLECEEQMQEDMEDWEKNGN